MAKVLQVLLLSEHYVTVAEYLITCQRPLSLLLFGIRLFTSANVMIHRNSLGQFSTMTEEESRRLYYYHKSGLGQRRRLTDWEVLEPLIPPTKSTSIDPTNDLDQGAVLIREDLEVAEAKEEEEEEEGEGDEEDDEDQERFRVGEITYFKDRRTKSNQKIPLIPSFSSLELKSVEEEDVDDDLNLNTEGALSPLERKDLSQLRMKDAIAVFHMMTHYYLNQIVEVRDEGFGSTLARKVWWRLLREAILCRPVSLSLEEVKQMVWTNDEKLRSSSSQVDSEQMMTDFWQSIEE